MAVSIIGPMINNSDNNNNNDKPMIEAKTNFYLYVNQTWIDDPKNTILEDYTSLNLYTELMEHTLQKQISCIKELCKNKVEISDQKKLLVAIWNASIRLTSNWTNASSNYIPLSRELEILDAYLMPHKPITHIDDLNLRIAEYFHYSWLNQIPNIFNFHTEIDDSSNRLNIVLEIINPFPYRKFAQTHENNTIDQFKRHLELVSLIINENCTTQLNENFVTDVLWFEDIIASCLTPEKRTTALTGITDQSNESSTTQPHIFFEEIYEIFGFDQILDQDSVILCDEVIKKIISLVLCEDNFSKYRSYLQYKIIETFYRFTSYDLYNIFNPSQKNDCRMREKYSITLINEWVGGEIDAHQSVEENVISSTIKEIVGTIENLVRDSEQLSDPIKQKILDKLKRIEIIIGSPDHSNQCTELKINDEDNLYDIFKKIMNYQSNKFFESISLHSVKNKYQSPINGYYSLTTNRLVVPSGMIQEPLFSNNLYFDAANFGKLYTIITSTITRGLDDYIDGELFKSNIDCLKSQSNENLSDSNLRVLISDFWGLSISLEMFKKRSDSIQSNESVRVILEGYASLWRQITTEKNRQNQINTGLSIPGYVRARIVNNLNEFYDIYGVSEGDPMYIEPKKRIKLL